MELRGKRVLVTGGAGFLGKHVVKELEKRECSSIDISRSVYSNLTDREACRHLLCDTKPDVIIHLAAKVGGIGANRKNPASFFYENLQMGLNILEMAHLFCIPKVVLVGTVCSYPKYTPIPFHEEDIWNGYPEETNAPYGIAKKALLVMSQTYRQQYNFNSIYLIPANLYGPGDTDNLEDAHVIPTLIRKFYEAKLNKEDKVILWGTGKPTREFLYVEEAARAIVLATEKYDKAEPVNLGTNCEISIKELSESIADLVGYKGEIEWDTSKPDGQPRRCLSILRAYEEFQFKSRMPLLEGLRKTVDWYVSGKETNSSN